MRKCGGRSGPIPRFDEEFSDTLSSRRRAKNQSFVREWVTYWSSNVLQYYPWRVQNRLSRCARVDQILIFIYFKQTNRIYVLLIRIRDLNHFPDFKKTVVDPRRPTPPLRATVEQNGRFGRELSKKCSKLNSI